MDVFEYGSGNSTFWWAARAKSVVSCEHSREWYEQLSGRVPKNVELRLAALDENGQYARNVIEDSRTYHIVVIDGRDRVNCARNAVRALKADGVLVWDNSERASYASGLNLMAELGFKRLDFEGMGPVNSYSWRTSIFYKAQNCLDI
jgi:hypothetical protein